LAIAQDSGKVDRCLSYVLIGDLGAEVTQLRGIETTGNGGAVSSGWPPGRGAAHDGTDLQKVGFVFLGRVMLSELKVVR
jgi:hypothetical protein